mgnify:CR=1 FL=1
MALTKITGQVINDTTGLVVGVTTVGGGVSAVDGFFSGIVTFSNDVSIAGTLTYEDVTNIDAVGLVTARNGIVVGSGITLSKDGDGFFTGIVTATSFVGSGAELTGVASTENIRPNTNATFLQNVVVVGTSTVTGNIIPSSDSATDIGTNSVRFQNAYVDTYYGDGSNLTGISAGISTEAASISGITTYLNLSKDDHELVVTGTNTISVIGGAQGSSHTLRLQNSGIATITLDSTYFKFASGGTPAFPTTDGAISLVSFTIHKAGAVGVNTVLLTGVSVSFS